MTKQFELAALEAFFRIAQAWQLSDGEQAVLLGADVHELVRWRLDPVTAVLSQDASARLRYIVDIDAALQDLLPMQERADAWVRQPNKAALFGGGSALERMLGGRLDDLKDVADYLASIRSGDFS
jgi:hypothetical protein